MNKEEMGYEITLKGPWSLGYRVYCVDSFRTVRGFYTVGFRHYFSDWELWADDKSSKRMSGDFKEGGLVSILDLEGETIIESGNELKELEVIEINEVYI